jgi:hypothetical protein
MLQKARDSTAGSPISLTLLLCQNQSKRGLTSKARGMGFDKNKKFMNEILEKKQKQKIYESNS